MTDSDEKPPKVAPALKAAPAIRQIYWCAFPKDAQLPEFWKRRSVIIISYKNTLFGAVTVVPCSSDPQDNNKWAVRLPDVANRKPLWAICDKPTTVAVSRLTPDKSGIVRLEEPDFNRVLERVLAWLPRMPALKTD